MKIYKLFLEEDDQYFTFQQDQIDALYVVYEEVIEDAMDEDDYHEYFFDVDYSDRVERDKLAITALTIGEKYFMPWGPIWVEVEEANQ